MKKFFKEFKAFIMRGNILDMAVGVIIGGAFNAIVTAFTNKIIMPLVNLALSGASGGLESAYTFLKVVKDVNDEIDLTKSIYIDWGAFITAVLNFLIVALTLFVIIKAAMVSSKFLHKAADATKTKLTKEDKKAMKEAGMNPHKKAEVNAYLEQKAAKEAEEKAKADAEAAAKAEEERKANPTEADLLKEIRDLLKKKA